MFIALFLQIQLVLFYSFISYQPPVFVEHFIPQIDLSDFVVAPTSDWLHHLNPYLRPRFDKPPATLLVGLPFQHMTPAHAALLFFFADLAVVAASLAAIVRHFRLSRTETLLLFGVASVYWPTFFLIERGNLDGFMLALILVTILSKNSYLQALSFSFSISLKAYSGLLFAPLFAVRAWSRILLAVACLILILLPFHSLIVPFIHSQAARTSDRQLTENLSPALLFAAFTNTRRVRVGYFLLWFASYLGMASRYRNAPLNTRMIYSLPWMLAFPFEVYPYTGILLLPVLIQRAREMAFANRITLRDYAFLAGFILVGFQQSAWAGLLPPVCRGAHFRSGRQSARHTVYPQHAGARRPPRPG